MDAQQTSVTNKVVFKKAGKLGTNRACNLKRRTEDSSSSSSDVEEISHATARKRACGTNPMVQTTAKSREDDKAGPSALRFSYKSTGSDGTQCPADMGATMLAEVDTERDKDSQAQFERALKIQKEMRGKEEDHVYRGMSAYGGFYEKKDSAAGNASSGLVRKGPIRAPVYMRRSIRWDYRPDICKDYKETGFCGFGDSCIFLHDRSDYKHGWELEKEWEQGRYGKDDEDIHEYEIKESVEELPTHCPICEQPFNSPVVTKCKHYFCEKCALQHSRKTLKCFVCETGTMGLFTHVRDFKGKLTSRKVADSDSGAESDDSLNNVGATRTEALSEEEQVNANE